MSKLQPRQPDPIVSRESVKPPTTLDDPRNFVDKAKDTAGHLLDLAAESELVDQATNLAADIARERGHNNTKALARKVEEWVDDAIGKHGGLWGKIFKRLPITGFLTKQMGKLVEVIADWLEEFSDASEEDGAEAIR